MFIILRALYYLMQSGKLKNIHSNFLLGTRPEKYTSRIISKIHDNFS